MCSWILTHQQLLCSFLLNSDPDSSGAFIPSFIYKQNHLVWILWRYNFVTFVCVFVCPYICVCVCVFKLLSHLCSRTSSVTLAQKEMISTSIWRIVIKDVRDPHRENPNVFFDALYIFLSGTSSFFKLNLKHFPFGLKKPPLQHNHKRCCSPQGAKQTKQEVFLVELYPGPCINYIMLFHSACVSRLFSVRFMKV